jgi:hypothetical protein
MKTIDVSFIIKVNRDAYKETSWTTSESYFQDAVIGHLGKDAKIFTRMMKNQTDVEKKEYEPFIANLNQLKSDILNTISYEKLSNINNIDEIKVQFSFTYIDNVKATIEDMIQVWIFNVSIQDANTLAEMFLNMSRTQIPKEQRKMAAGVYQHIADFLTEARQTVEYKIR